MHLFVVKLSLAKVKGGIASRWAFTSGNLAWKPRQYLSDRTRPRCQSHRDLPRYFTRPRSAKSLPHFGPAITPRGSLGPGLFWPKTLTSWCLSAIREHTAWIIFVRLICLSAHWHSLTNNWLYFLVNALLVPD